MGFVGRSKGLVVLLLLALFGLAVLWSRTDEPATWMEAPVAGRAQGDASYLGLRRPSTAIAEAGASSGTPPREQARAGSTAIRGRVELVGGHLAGETLRVAARIAFERPESEAHKLASTLVEHDGSFVLQLPDGASGARLFADARTLDPGEGVAARAGETGIVVRAERRAEILGRVTLPAGMSVPHGETLGAVRMEWKAAGPDGRKQTLYPDSDGRFEYPLAPVGVEFTLAIDASFALRRELRIAPLAPGEVRELGLELEAGRTISGRVLDEHGTAVADAEVLVLARTSLDGEARDGRLLPRASTDGEGRFECGGLEGRAWELVVRAPGLCLESTVVDLAAGDLRDLGVVLRRGRTLAGRVVWEDGTPARGFSLSVHGGTFCDVERDDENGFLLYGLEDRSYRITAEMHTRSASGTATVADALPGGAPIVLVLASTPLAELHGEVVDPSGAPIPGAQVSSGTSETRTNREGRFTLRKHPDAELRVTADGYVTCEQAAPGAGPARFVLERGIRVRGRVVSSNGEPVWRAVVTGWGFQPVESGSDGAFEVDAAELETSLRASVPDFAISPLLAVGGRPGEHIEGLVLTLGASGRIGGRVLAASGAPCRGLVLSWWSATCTKRGVTDDSGAFLLRDLPVEAGYLSTTPDEHGRRAEVELDLVPGTNEVELRLPPLDPVLVHLRVTHGGVPAQGRVMLGSARFLCEGELDREGRVSIELPCPGACTGRIFLSMEDEEEVRRFECTAPSAREILLEAETLPRVAWDDVRR